MPIGEPIRITIIEKPELDPITEYFNKYERARNIALDYFYKGTPMNIAISSAANEVDNVNVSELSNAVKNWEEFVKIKPAFEPREEREKRALEAKDAYEDEGGNIRYYDNIKNEK